MKTALKIGFSTTTQHWKSTLLHSRFLIFTFILVTLLECLLWNELSELISWIIGRYNYSNSIINVDVLDLSDNSNSLANYLSYASRNFFYEFIILNSFFLGVYYHHTGFPEQGDRSTSGDNILDVPIEQSSRPTLGLVLKYIEKEDRTYYFKILFLFIVVQFFGGIVGNFFYNIFALVGSIYYLFFGLTTYLFLLLLYFNWLDIPFSKFNNSKDKWLLIIVCGLFFPNAGWFIWSLINSIGEIAAYTFSGFSKIGAFVRFLGLIAYCMLLVPFLSIFYSQTLIYFKNEEEA